MHPLLFLFLATMLAWLLVWHLSAATSSELCSVSQIMPGVVYKPGTSQDIVLDKGQDDDLKSCKSILTLTANFRGCVDPLGDGHELTEIVFTALNFVLQAI